MRNLITCLTVSMLSGVTFADTWTVDDDGKADFDNIQAAVDAASDGDEIVVYPGTYSGGINTYGLAIELVSSELHAAVIDGGATSRGFTCNSNETSETVIFGFLIRDCHVGDNGGGMLLLNSSPTISNCRFVNNAAVYGGGVFADNSSSTWNDCTFTGNSANTGGGMYNSGGSSLVLINCDFNSNSSSYAGGGIYCEYGNLSLTNCDFFNNTDTVGEGGGIYCTWSDTTLTGCNFNFNSTNTDGGGICFRHGEHSITNCTFIDNTALDEGGGAATTSESSASFNNCTFENNTATSGGGMNNSDWSNPTLTNCTFASNTATFGGGMYNRNNSNPLLSNCTFEDNTTIYHGGGMYNNYSNPTLDNCTFTNNIANDYGGGILNYDNSSPTLTNCTFTGNTAGGGPNGYGGGMFNWFASSPTLENCNLTNNTTGGMQNYDNSNPTLTDTIVCGNTPPQISGTYTDGGGNTIADVCPPLDSDGDGVPDYIDNCYLYNPDQADCNENGIGDVCDVADQTSYDCDQNGVPDECQPDCDGDGWIDPCDNDGDCDGDGIPDNCETDCQPNGIPDDCDIILGISQDCNGNGVPDECDIANGLEEDCDENEIPDSCDLENDPSLDCDGDGVFDSCAINDGLVEDCNGDGLIDSCQIDDDPSLDCNDNAILDSCELVGGVPSEGAIQWTIEEGGNGHWYLGVTSNASWESASSDAQLQGGYLVTCTTPEENSFVRSILEIGSGGIWIGLKQSPNGEEPAGGWEWVTGEPLVWTNWGSGQPDDNNGDEDYAEMCCNASIWGDLGMYDLKYIIEFDADGTLQDCNANGVPDECDIDDGTSNDVNGNGIPDECEVDCNGNGVPDHWDIKKGTSEDCNTNGVPDECDIDDGTSTDWNENGIPDECEVDCNNNGYPDDYDIQMEWSYDVNGDGIPDECQCIADITGDNMVDVHDLLAIIGYWGSAGPLGDVNEDGIVDVTDLLIVVGNWGPCYLRPLEGAVQWLVEDGGNDHWYGLAQAAGGEVCFDEIRLLALDLGGDLVIIQSDAENSFVTDLLTPSGDYWIGLIQNLSSPGYSEPSGGWEWINGTPLDYSHWDSSEPDDPGNTENVCGINSGGWWYDMGSCDNGTPQYAVVEWSD